MTREELKKYSTDLFRRYDSVDKVIIKGRDQLLMHNWIQEPLDDDGNNEVDNINYIPFIKEGIFYQELFSDSVGYNPDKPHRSGISYLLADPEAGWQPDGCNGLLVEDRVEEDGSIHFKYFWSVSNALPARETIHFRVLINPDYKPNIIKKNTILNTYNNLGFEYDIDIIRRDKDTMKDGVAIKTFVNNLFEGWLLSNHFLKSYPRTIIRKQYQGIEQNPSNRTSGRRGRVNILTKYVYQLPEDWEPKNIKNYTTGKWTRSGTWKRITVKTDYWEKNPEAENDADTNRYYFKKMHTDEARLGDIELGELQEGRMRIWRYYIGGDVHRNEDLLNPDSTGEFGTKVYRA
jgi:hypothetical protein